MSNRIERLRSARARLVAHALATGLTAAFAAGCVASYDSRPVAETAAQFSRSMAPSEPALEVAAETLYERADLADYTAFALLHHKGLEAAFERWRAAAEEVGIASALPNPRFTYGEFLEEIQTRTGAQERSFGLTQAFPWPGTLDARAEIAARRADVLRTQMDRERLSVAMRVAIAFHDYAFLADEVAKTRDVLDLVRSLEPIVQVRVRAGGGQADVLRLQVEVGRLEDDVRRLEERRRVLSARLADAIQLPTEGNRLLPFPSAVVPDAVVPVSDSARERILARVAGGNPHLLMLIEKLRVARAAQDLAAFAARPDFSAGLKYFETGDALNGSTRGSGDDPLLLSVSVGLPLWRASYAAQRRQADHLVRAAQADLDAARSSINADAIEVLFQADDAARRIRLYRESLLPRAREAVQLTLTSYRAGTATVLDLLDSERALLEFELTYRRAIRDYQQGQARLTEITGGPEA